MFWVLRWRTLQDKSASRSIRLSVSKSDTEQLGAAALFPFTPSQNKPHIVRLFSLADVRAVPNGGPAENNALCFTFPSESAVLSIAHPRFRLPFAYGQFGAVLMRCDAQLVFLPR